MVSDEKHKETIAMNGYKETLDWLFRQLPMFSRVGAAAYKPGLDTSLDLDKHFGHPHRRFRSIHVAGTNGKGSCSHLLAAMLQSEGYRVGLYTSPHLVDFRERIRVDGEMIPEHAVVDFVERFRASEYDGHPSFFELTMMMAFDWFARCGVEYAVIEVGMGGRLDSTNIITPEACVITNISKDHTQFLGDTLPKIAGEKAGIIKPGIPVVVGEAEGDVRKVFEKKAADEGAPIVFAEDEGLLEEAADTSDGFVCRSGLIGDFICPLSGDYQRKNIATVLSAVRMLRKCGIAVSDESARRGFRDVVELTGLQGRWMKLNDAPLTICDTGHNEAGLTYNLRKLHNLMAVRPAGKLRMVIGFVADKDVDRILSMLPKDAEYYITNADIPRALPSADLADRCREAGLAGEMVVPVVEAYRKAMADASDGDIVYVGGSTFVVADLLKDI